MAENHAKITAMGSSRYIPTFSIIAIACSAAIRVSPMLRKNTSWQILSLNCGSSRNSSSPLALDAISPTQLKTLAFCSLSSNKALRIWNILCFSTRSVYR